jgi:competence protein ComEA
MLGNESSEPGSAKAIDRLRETVGNVTARPVRAIVSDALVRIVGDDRLARRGRIALIAIAGVALVMVVGGIGLRSCSRQPEQVSAPLFASAPVDAPTAASVTTQEMVVVHAAGAVRAPGLYRLAKGARVADVLEAAGGVTDDADLDRVNLAALAGDSQRVFIPRRGAPVPATPGDLSPSGDPGGNGIGQTGPVDLNTASAQELDALPGVGPATAAAIVSHREERGPFTSVDDLLDVRGIGAAKLEGLRGLVTAG